MDMNTLGKTARTTGQTAACAVALLTLAGVAGCGDAHEAGDASVPSAASQWQECDTDAFAAADGKVAELENGQGDLVVVKLPVDGPCAGGLVARTGDGVHGQDVAGLDLDPDTAQVVRLGDHDRLLRIDSAAHPRGGFQPHLFAPWDGASEVTLDGQPLLPFVATDGGAAPMTATCGLGSVEVLTASTSKPPGVVLAWDVQRTSYAVDGAEVRETGSKQIRDHAADPLLRKDMPELFEPSALFEGC